MNCNCVGSAERRDKDEVLNQLLTVIASAARNHIIVNAIEIDELSFSIITQNKDSCHFTLDGPNGRIRVLNKGKQTHG